MSSKYTYLDYYTDLYNKYISFLYIDDTKKTFYWQTCLLSKKLINVKNFYLMTPFHLLLYWILMHNEEKKNDWNFWNFKW